MSPTSRVFTLMTVIPVSIAVMAMCVCRAGAQDLAKAEAKIKALQKIVADDLSGQQEFAQTEADLLELLQQLKTTREPAAGSREAKVFDSLGELLIKVRARVPESYAGGSGQQTALPIPQFAENKLIGQIAQQLRKSQVDLLSQLRKNPDATQARELLIAVVLGQEELAWEAGWPFTDDEIKAYRPAGGLTKEIYLSRRQRVLKQINEDLKADFEAVGRESSREFAIFCPTSEADVSQITERLMEKRGKAAADWRERTKPFDETLRTSLFRR